MNAFTEIAMYGFPGVAVLLFLWLPAHRAVLACYLIGWMFLPIATFNLPGLPDYSKASATAISAMMGVLVVDPQRVTRFKYRWFDASVALLCLANFMTSVVNDYGLYDGLAGVLSTGLNWVVPYFLGRAYFNDVARRRELALAIFIAGLVYVPFCLIEIRLSPQLHTWVYGYHQHSFRQSFRFGGWRPTVFMQHGLMVGMWMTATSVVGVWLWYAASLKRLAGVPTGLLVLVLLVTTVLCKSFGALVLLAVGVAVLLWARGARSMWPIVVMLVIPPLFVTFRILGTQYTPNVIAVVRSLTPEERAGSLAFRMENEDLLMKRAMERPLFGFGHWGQSWVITEYSDAKAVTDGLWILTLGTEGLFGLTCLMAALAIPPIRGLTAWPTPARQSVDLAVLASLATIVGLYAIDCLPNAMTNPIFMICSGAVAATTGISGLASEQAAAAPRSLVDAQHRRMWPPSKR